MNRIQSNEVEVAEFPFRTALGNDSTSILDISSSKVLGKAKLKIFESDGNFRLLDLCTEGGTRLFDGSGSFKLENPSPNPLSANTFVNYELLEDSQVDLDIIDYRGIGILSIDSGFKSKGIYSVPFNINNIPTGFYFIRLKTPNQSIVKKIQIER